MSLFAPRKQRPNVDKNVDAARLEARATTEKITFIVSDALHSQQCSGAREVGAHRIWNIATWAGEAGIL
jgi:hypothetical protein